MILERIAGYFVACQMIKTHLWRLFQTICNLEPCLSMFHATKYSPIFELRLAILKAKKVAVREKEIGYQQELLHKI